MATGKVTKFKSLKALIQRPRGAGFFIIPVGVPQGGGWAANLVRLRLDANQSCFIRADR